MQLGLKNRIVAYSSHARKPIVSVGVNIWRFLDLVNLCDGLGIPGASVGSGKARVCVRARVGAVSSRGSGSCDSGKRDDADWWGSQPGLR